MPCKTDIKTAAFHAAYGNVALVAHVAGVAIGIAEGQRCYNGIPRGAPQVIIPNALARLYAVQLRYARFEGHCLRDLNIALMEAPKAVYKRARAHHVEPVFGVINGAYAVRNVLILKAHAPLFKRGYNAHKLGELLFVLLRIDQRKV